MTILEDITQKCFRKLAYPTFHYSTCGTLCDLSATAALLFLCTMLLHVRHVC